MTTTFLRFTGGPLHGVTAAPAADEPWPPPDAFLVDDVLTDGTLAAGRYKLVRASRLTDEQLDEINQPAGHEALVLGAEYEWEAAP